MTTSLTLYFYKAEEISAAHYILTDTAYSAHVFTKNLPVSIQTGYKIGQRVQIFFEGVCYNSSMYRYTLYVCNCQDEPW